MLAMRNNWSHTSEPIVRSVITATPHKENT